MKCPDCDGLLFVKRVEDIPITEKDKLNYNRLCDVECIDCEKVIYSQPYDSGDKFNIVKKL